MIQTYSKMVELTNNGKEIEVVKGIIGNEVLVQLIQLGDKYIVLVKGYNPDLIVIDKDGYILKNETDINYLFELIQVNFNTSLLNDVDKIKEFYAIQV